MDSGTISDFETSVPLDIFNSDYSITPKPDAESLAPLFDNDLKSDRAINFLSSNSQTIAKIMTIRLIGLLMPISIAAIAAVGYGLLKLNLGAAILLGAILAPTDPVLASEVQLKRGEQDELRFGLTSEGRLNDALAFPFVYFGLYWLRNERWQLSCQ